MGKQSNKIMAELSPNQREAAETIDRDVLVRAGAGSGKTKTLVARYLHLLDEHRDWLPADITAVTFTRKAAREMQSRIRQQMMELAYLPENAQDPDEKKFWLGRLNEMDSANIGTIHSLCGRILRTHPAEAGLDPAFSVLDDNNAAMLREQVVEEAISQISADPDYDCLLKFYPGSKLSRILTDMLKNRRETDTAMSIPTAPTAEYLKPLAAEVLSGPEFTGRIESYRTMIGEPDFDKKADKIADKIHGLITAYDKARESFSSGKHPVECICIFHSAFDDWSFSAGKAALKADAKWIRDTLRERFAFLTDKENRDAKWFIEFWDNYDRSVNSLRPLWVLIRDAYTKQLSDTQMIDFETMETLSLELLRSRPEIREKWIGSVKALLVDEYQDTNDAQAEMFTLLNPAHNRLFAVGDKKQSIYGFRGTNVALFDRRGEEVKASDGKDILLDVTYRPDADLLEPMGRLLDTIMADDALSVKEYYAAYEPMRTPEIPVNKKDPLPKDPPCIELLLGKIENKEDDPDDQLVGSMLAQRLTELMQAGLIRNWNDTVILCRTANDFKQFENALEARHIPYVTVAGKGYYDRPEIRDILNILSTAENPHDNAAFTGFLLSPVIGFSAEMTVRVFNYANKGGLKKSFYQAMMDNGFRFDDEEKQQKLERARSILSELIRISGQVPLDEVLEKAFRLTGIRTMLALDSGDRAWLNLDKLLPTARESGLTSVSEFLEYLENIKETGAREGEAPSDNNGAVRIMTIHQAKGLEFPVTIVCDNRFSTPKQPNFVQGDDDSYAFFCSPAHPRFQKTKEQADAKDKAEWLRLFYVAATRAKYRLILCGKMPKKLDGKTDSWLIRMLLSLPPDCTDPGERIISAWGAAEPNLRIRCCENFPEISEVIQPQQSVSVRINHEFELLLPIPERKREPRNPGNTAALTVGKLVHKGLELWRFPEADRNDPLLEEAFHKILLQTEGLSPEEQKYVYEKAVKLLARFRSSEAYMKINSADERRHEVPFSYTGHRGTINGVIDLLLKDSRGYTIIDFKTDELKSDSDLNMAAKDHSAQLKKYRQALNAALGVDPRCEICFLDFCGKTILYPIGKDPSPADEGPEEPDLWPEDEPEQDDFMFELNPPQTPGSYFEMP